MNISETAIADLKEHCVKYIKLRYENDISPNWSFGHDWNNTFPRDTGIPVYIKDTVYTALSLLFKQYNTKEKEIDFYLRYLIRFLDTGYNGLPTAPNILIKYISWILYYQFEGIKEILKNQSNTK